MPRGPRIGPKVTDERAYYQALRKTILNPLRAEMNLRVRSAGESYEFFREAIAQTREFAERLPPDAEPVMRRNIERQVREHKQRFTKQMRRHFGAAVDLLEDTPIDLDARIRENVALVKTIGPRLHDGLEKRLAELATEAPFDQELVRDALAREFKSAGYNLRRLTRDQTNKLTGQLNQARQTEVGIDRYEWITAGDGRVRNSHAANSGEIFTWETPPDTGHPGEAIQCRCIAVPIITTQPRPGAGQPPEKPAVVTGKGRVRSEAARKAAATRQARKPSPVSKKATARTRPERPLRPGDDGWRGFDGIDDPFFDTKGLNNKQFAEAMNSQYANNEFNYWEAPAVVGDDVKRLTNYTRGQYAHVMAWMDERFPLARLNVREVKGNVESMKAAAIAWDRVPGQDLRTAGADGRWWVAQRDGIGLSPRAMKQKEYDWLSEDKLKSWYINEYGNGRQIVGQRHTRYGADFGIEDDQFRNMATIVHEFGHHVAFTASKRWRTYVDDVSDPAFGEMRFLTLDRRTAMQRRFDAMVERNSHLTEEVDGVTFGPDSWARWKNVSEYAGENIDEFSAESFSAVTMYGDRAPLVARLWVREMLETIDEMEDEARDAIRRLRATGTARKAEMEVKARARLAPDELEELERLEVIAVREGWQRGDAELDSWLRYLRSQELDMREAAERAAREAAERAAREALSPEDLEELEWLEGLAEQQRWVRSGQSLTLWREALRRRANRAGFVFESAAAREAREAAERAIREGLEREARQVTPPTVTGDPIPVPELELRGGWMSRWGLREVDEQRWRTEILDDTFGYRGITPPDTWDVPYFDREELIEAIQAGRRADISDQGRAALARFKELERNIELPEGQTMARTIGFSDQRSLNRAIGNVAEGEEYVTALPDSFMLTDDVGDFFDGETREFVLQIETRGPVRAVGASVEQAGELILGADQRMVVVAREVLDGGKRVRLVVENADAVAARQVAERAAREAAERVARQAEPQAAPAARPLTQKQRIARAEKVPVNELEIGDEVLVFYRKEPLRIVGFSEGPDGQRLIEFADHTYTPHWPTMARVPPAAGGPPPPPTPPPAPPARTAPKLAGRPQVGDRAQADEWWRKWGELGYEKGDEIILDGELVELDTLTGAPYRVRLARAVIAGETPPTPDPDTATYIRAIDETSTKLTVPRRQPFARGMSLEVSGESGGPWEGVDGDVDWSAFWAKVGPKKAGDEFIFDTPMSISADVDYARSFAETGMFVADTAEDITDEASVLITFSSGPFRGRPVSVPWGEDELEVILSAGQRMRAKSVRESVVQDRGYRRADYDRWTAAGRSGPEPRNVLGYRRVIEIDAEFLDDVVDEAALPSPAVPEPTFRQAPRIPDDWNVGDDAADNWRNMIADLGFDPADRDLRDLDTFNLSLDTRQEVLAATRRGERFDIPARDMDEMVEFDRHARDLVLPESGMVRGLRNVDPDDPIRALQPGDEVTTVLPDSWTLDDAARYRGRASESVVLQVEGGSAVHAVPRVRSPQLQEMMVPAGQRLRVVSRTVDDDGLTRIGVEFVDDTTRASVVARQVEELPQPSGPAPGPAPPPRPPADPATAAESVAARALATAQETAAARREAGAALKRATTSGADPAEVEALRESAAAATRAAAAARTAWQQAEEAATAARGAAPRTPAPPPPPTPAPPSTPAPPLPTVEFPARRINADEFGDQIADLWRSVSEPVREAQPDTADISVAVRSKVLADRAAGREPTFSAATKDTMRRFEDTAMTAKFSEEAPLVRSMRIDDNVRAQWEQIEPDVGGSYTIELPESFSFDPRHSRTFGVREGGHDTARAAADDPNFMVELRIHGEGRFSPVFKADLEEQEMVALPGMRLRVTGKQTDVELFDTRFELEPGSELKWIRRTVIDAVIEPEPAPAPVRVVTTAREAPAPPAAVVEPPQAPTQPATPEPVPVVAPAERGLLAAATEAEQEAVRTERVVQRRRRKVEELPGDESALRDLEYAETRAAAARERARETAERVSPEALEAATQQAAARVAQRAAAVTAARAVPEAGAVDDLVRALDLDAADAGARARLGRTMAAQRIVDEGGLPGRMDDDEFDLLAAAAIPSREDVHRALVDAFGVDDYRERVRAALSESVTSAYMAIPRAKLSKVVKEDQFKNSLETGKGSFTIIADERIPLERQVFGITKTADDLVPDDLPKYGFLAGRGEMDWDRMVGRGYGENFVEFKPEVRARATATLGDSYSGNVGYNASPATALNDIEVDDFLTSLFGYEADLTVPAFRREHLAKFVETNDYRDLIRARGEDYAEVQMFGQLGLDDVAAIEVESLKYSKTLRRALDRGGHEDVVVRPARDHSQLKAIRDGEIDALVSLSPTDIDNFGDYYIDRVFSRSIKSYFGNNQRWRDPQRFPPSIYNWVERLIDTGGDNMTTAEKRQALTDWYGEVSKGSDSALPRTFTEDFKKTRAGFTEDVLDQTLLEGPQIPV